MSQILSKSDYMLFLKHPAWLWVKKYRKNLLPAISDSAQANFDDGHRFEEVAEKLFPESTKLGFNDFKEYEGLVFKTSEALKENLTILQGRFQFQDLTCIVDVLQKLDSGGYKLTEIKSSTKVKPEHEYDLAFQFFILNSLGIDVRKVSIMLVNSEYIRDGDIRPQELVKEEEVTSRVEELQSLTKSETSKALKLLLEKKMPDISFKYLNHLEIPGTSWLSEWIEVYENLIPKPQPYNIFELTHINQDLLIELESRNISLIKDIPLDLNLKERQVSQVLTTISQERRILKDELKSFLQTFAFPLYFFDYETLASSVPFFDGMGPHKDYPFQYSLHVMEKPEAEIKHFEYLHLENSDPTLSLLQTLRKHVGPTGTILSWYKAYENSCNVRLASKHPEYTQFLEDLNQRTVDLMTPFSEQWVIDYKFLGSSSIKKVLPVIVPELGYDNLEIKNGLKARKNWIETVIEGKNAESRAKIISDLKKYCTLDTWAMVRIYQELLKMIK